MNNNFKASTIDFINANIFSLNFRGDRWGKNGTPSFCVYVDDENLVKSLQEDGVNVKLRAPYHEDDEPRYFVSVNVNMNYEFDTPQVVVWNGKVERSLTAETVGELNDLDIEYVNLKVRKHKCGDGHYNLYLKNMYVAINEDDLKNDFYNHINGGNECSTDGADDPDDCPFED